MRIFEGRHERVMDLQSAAGELSQRGYRPSPCRACPPPAEVGQSQTSHALNWQLAEESDLGVSLGAPSNLIALELGNAEARRAADRLLPMPVMISGRISEQGAVYFYVCDRPPRITPDAEDLPGLYRKESNVNVRTSGVLCLLPSPRFPAGARNSDRGAGNGYISLAAPSSSATTIASTQLETGVGLVAAVAFLAQHRPRVEGLYVGSVLGDALRNAGWPQERTWQFLQAVLAASKQDRPDFATSDPSRRACGPREAWAVIDDAYELPSGISVSAILQRWLGVPPVGGDPPATMGFPDLAEAEPEPAPDWPSRPAASAFRGLAGDFVAALEPVCEADRVALLVQFLVMFGSVVGRSPFFRVGGVRHYANEYLALVGSTAKARKGGSFEITRQLFSELDPSWSGQADSGLATAPGLIWRLRDPSFKPVKVRTKDGPPRFEIIESDPGVRDKRLLVIEPEFSRVLRRIQRSDDALSATLREAWDGGSLASLVRGSGHRATGVHLSIIADITPEELDAELDPTQSANGFGNRFLWCAVQRSKLLPSPGDPDEAVMAGIRQGLRSAIDAARRAAEVQRDPAAEEYWRAIYPHLSANRPGTAGMLLARAEPHTMRLALIYALLDGSDTIRLEHLQAGHELWTFCERSVRHLFGDKLGDPLAEKLLYLFEHQFDPWAGIPKTDIWRRLGNRHTKREVDRALELLRRMGHVSVVHRKQLIGRPVEIWRRVSNGINPEPGHYPKEE